MNKRELIHKIVDLMIDVEESTGRCAFLDYSGHVDQLALRIVPSKKEYNTRIAEVSFYTDNIREDMVPEGIMARIEELVEKTRNWKPEDVPIVHLSLDREKAMELGLI